MTDKTGLSQELGTELCVATRPQAFELEADHFAKSDSILHQAASRLLALEGEHEVGPTGKFAQALDFDTPRRAAGAKGVPRILPCGGIPVLNGRRFPAPFPSARIGIDVRLN
jgi:hypothetical protein